MLNLNIFLYFVKKKLIFGYIQIAIYYDDRLPITTVIKQPINKSVTITRYHIMESHFEKDVVFHVQPLSFLSYKVLVRSGYEPSLLNIDFVKDIAPLYFKEEKLCSRILRLIRNSGIYSVVYGGYIRDLIARKVYKETYITRNRHMHTWEKIYGCDTSYPNVFQLRDIDVHVENLRNVERIVEFLISNIIDSGRYGIYKRTSGYFPSKNTVRLYFYHIKYPFIHIKVDISCIIKLFDSFDFDINTLGIYTSQYDVPCRKNQFGNRDFISRILCDLPKIQILNSECNPIEVIMNIVRGRFIVLTGDGKPSIKHVSPNDCIDSKTEKGEKLIERIKKMRKRGWVLQNERCSNENCILNIKL